MNLDEIMWMITQSLISSRGPQITPKVTFIDGGCYSSIVTMGWVPKIDLGAYATDTTRKVTLSAAAVAHTFRDPSEVSDANIIMSESGTCV